MKKLDLENIVYDTKKVFYSFPRFLPLIICSFLFLYILLNLSGFCFQRFKYLSYDDKAEAIYTYFNNKNKYSTKGEILRRIPYESFEEFKKENPSSISINDQEGYDIPPDNFWDRILGFDSGVVITYRFKYYLLDQDNVRHLNVSSGYLALSNCGSPVRGIPKH